MSAVFLGEIFQRILDHFPVITGAEVMIDFASQESALLTLDFVANADPALLRLPTFHLPVARMIFVITFTMFFVQSTASQSDLMRPCASRPMNALRARFRGT
jgi:hypothetical protein